jgi:flavin-dependent dehydrogenase
MKEFDAVIIGAGLAGLQCAKLLSHNGIRVLLVDRKRDLTTAIHTTGIFVRKTIDDFNFSPASLGPPIRNVTLYSPQLHSLDLESNHDEFRVGKMGMLYRSLLDDSLAAGAEFACGTRYVSAIRLADAVTVRLEKGGRAFDVETKVLVGADGATSRVARDLRLDENKEWIVGFEEVYCVKSEGTPRLHCFFDGDLAPGYLAWIADDGEEVHVGVGGYAADFDPRNALSEFKKKTASIIDLSNAQPAETRGGRIPVNGILRHISNESGLLIGDAAGAVSPLTAGGLDPCMRLSSFAADVITQRVRLDDGQILLQYSGDLFRTRFISRLWMRRIISVFKSQTFIECGFRILSTKIGVRLASHIFFGRGSFPDVNVLMNNKSALVGEQMPLV